MAYKITVDQPNIGPGTEVFIDGLGTFKNGEATVVDADQANHFRNAHGRVNDEGKWEQGPTLAQAKLVGVTVERVSDKDEPETKVTQTSTPPAPTKKDGGK